METFKAILAERMDSANQKKLDACSPTIVKAIYEALQLMNPKSIFISSGSKEDNQYIKKQALAKGEELALSHTEHTMHFDSPGDQGRDTANTKYLAHPDTKISSLQKKMDHAEGVAEVREKLTNSMANREMIVAFISRGPIGSKVSNPTLQFTDSFYVAHSEEMLYRLMSPKQFSDDVEEKGYMFINMHSAGELTETNVSKNLSDRRIYMDVETLTSYSVNAQYAGNTVAPKKINHRFDNWQCLQHHFGERMAEHMFITGMEIDGEMMYFAGAYPSGCGKTGTAMTGTNLIGDDLAKLFIDKPSGEVRGVNPESGMFGIIDGVNPKDDPETFEAFAHSEIIYSNLMMSNGQPYWTDMGTDLPETGKNYEGEWTKTSGARPNHKNGRFTVRLSALVNYDPKAEDPDGVPISGLLFGGRDYAVMPPVVMAHDWINTIVHGAIIRSQATATEIGASGEKRSPYANEAFFPGPLGIYIRHYKAFGENKNIQPDKLPAGFQVNYWLYKSSRGELAPGEKDGLIGGKEDTKIWMYIMGLMKQGKVDSIWTPIGRIPKYEDLQPLFTKLRNKEYPKETYEKQFSFYVDKIIGRIDVSLDEFGKEEQVPEEFFNTLKNWKSGLEKLTADLGSNIITPDQLAAYKA